MDEEILLTLKELLRWTRASSFASVRESLRNALPDAKSKMIYQMSDGLNSRDEIRTRCKVGSASIQSVWRRCLSMGLMEEGSAGKKIRIFDLRDFGLLDEVAGVAEQENDGTNE